MRSRSVLLAMIALVCMGVVGLAASSALAQEAYPTRPIQVIVPFPPGGVADLVGRPFAVALEKELKQPVVIVNKTGAGGAVGMQAAAVSKPDGYNLMVALSSISVMPEVDALFGRPSTYKLKDFAPIALLSADPTILVVKADAPWKTVADFVADAKKRPGEIKYASSGVYGTMHVAMEMLAYSAGIKLRHIPTGGGGPALNALLGGHVEAISGGPNVSIPHIKAGTLKALAGWGEKRLEGLPNVPTLQELVSRIAPLLVNKRKAACVNIVPRVDSLFWWQGKLDSAQESLLMLKTRGSLVPEIIEVVKKTHSYQVPEIIALPIIGGNEDYLEWVDRELGGD